MIVRRHREPGNHSTSKRLRGRQKAALTAPEPDETASSSEEDEVESASLARRAGMLLLEVSFAIVVALILTSLLRMFVFQIFEVPSGSMEHTLDEQDRIAALRMSDFERGDVVVFENPPSQWMGLQPQSSNALRRAMERIYLLPDSSDVFLVKRVMGMPGDRVKCCDQEGRITVNGEPLEEESYLYRDSAGVTVAPSSSDFDVTVPAGHIFVMGDHRNGSADSRIHLCEVPAPGFPKGSNGFVPVDNVVGPVGAIVLPFGRITGFSVPDTFADVPDAQGDPPPEPILGPGTCP